jgi:hypothetical protein
MHDTPGKWATLQWKVWADSDDRMANVYVLFLQSQSARFIPVGGEQLFGATYDFVLTSPLVEAHAVRAGRSVADVTRSHRIYDNGDAQIYDARRPLFERGDRPFVRD